jgi:leucyl-tRNA synthetase
LEENKVKCLIKEIKGKELLGTLIFAPNSVYENVYILPMLTISLLKGTGIVTSVPSDSPDDYAALQDLQDEKFREEHGVKEEWVKDFKVFPIIEIPDYGTTAAVKVYEDKKIKSQKDAKLLLEAKELVYNKGFYEGKFVYGPEKGK